MDKVNAKLKEELKYINEQKYEELSTILTEEERMIGAWIGKVLKEK